MGKAILYICNKYRLTYDLEAAALYGTQHEIEETLEIFNQKAKDRGYDIDPEEIHIEKDENKTVSIKWTYQDKISFFSIILKKFEFGQVYWWLF